MFIFEYKRGNFSFLDTFLIIPNYVSTIENDYWWWLKGHIYAHCILIWYTIESSIDWLKTFESRKNRSIPFWLNNRGVNRSISETKIILFFISFIILFIIFIIIIIIWFIVNFFFYSTFIYPIQQTSRERGPNIIN